ncbi:MAG: hypothetical protein Q7O66_16780 [Dehalococcoidia bacterium]|nr:hypothetical protein [Dehalococcoidia bacterium]
MTRTERAQSYRDDAAACLLIDGWQKYSAMYAAIADAIEAADHDLSDHEIFRISMNVPIDETAIDTLARIG